MSTANRKYFTIKEDADGWRARLFDINGKLIWWTEGYSKREHAETAVRIAVQTNGSTPVIYR